MFPPRSILERTYELSTQFMGEKFCCRVMKCTIKVIHFKHCFPMTQGNCGAKGREEIMSHWPEWICNTGMTHQYHLYLAWRIRLWANITNVKVQISLHVNILCKTKPCWKFIIYLGKYYQKKKTMWLIDNQTSGMCVCTWPFFLPFHKCLTLLIIKL